jgi:tetratricopeptide (TPR) repeat protein
MRVALRLLITCLILFTPAVTHTQQRQPKPISLRKIIVALRRIANERSRELKSKGYQAFIEVVNEDKVNFLLNNQTRAVLYGAGANDEVLNAILENGPDREQYKQFSLYKRAGDCKAARKAADEYKNKFAGGDEARVKEIDDFLAACKPPPPPTPQPPSAVERHRQKMEQGEQALKNNPPKYADAEQAFKDAKSLLPDDPRAFYQLGQLYSAQSRYDEAIAEFAGARKLKSNDPLIHSALGIAYFQKKNYAGAVLALQDAATLGAADVDTYLYLGRAHFNLNVFQEAVIAFKRASELRPADAQLHFEIGEAYFKLNQPTEAFDSYNSAVDADPAFLAAAQKLVELKPRDPKARERLGDVYLRAKNYPEAKAAYDQVVRLSPNFAADHRKPVGLMHISAAEHVGGEVEKVFDQIKLMEKANVVLSGSEFQGALRVCMSDISSFRDSTVSIARREPDTNKCTKPSTIKFSDIDEDKRYVDFTHNNKNYVMAITAYRFKRGRDDDYIEFAIFRKVTP